MDERVGSERRLDRNRGRRLSTRWSRLGAVVSRSPSNSDTGGWRVSKFESATAPGRANGDRLHSRGRYKRSRRMEVARSNLPVRRREPKARLACEKAPIRSHSAFSTCALRIHRGDAETLVARSRLRPAFRLRDEPEAAWNSMARGLVRHSLGPTERHLSGTGLRLAQTSSWSPSCACSRPSSRLSSFGRCVSSSRFAPEASYAATASSAER